MKWKVVLFVIVCFLIACFPFIAAPENPTSNIGVFIGSFHPLLLHFPIVLLVLLVILELAEGFLSKTFATVPKSMKSMLVTGTVASILLVTILGFLLFRSGEYQGNLVRNHLLGGVGLSLLSAGVLLAFRLEKMQIYKSLLLISVLILIYTSHQGASLTHGQNFISKHIPITEKASAIESKIPQELIVYNDMIKPIFENKCYSCHNEHKTKGGLLMTSYANLVKGGKSDKQGIVGGQAKGSEVYHRITLPKDDDDHMPPESKVDLTDEERSLIEWWINDGASQDKLLGEGPTDPIMQAVVTSYLPKLYNSERLKQRQKSEQTTLAGELKKFGDNLGLDITIDKDSENGNFAVSMKMPPHTIDDKDIHELLKYKDVISKLSLPGADVTDNALFDIAKMSNLQSLIISNTSIDGSGLIYLKALAELKVLNLSHTKLTDAGLLNILQIPKLKDCYIFQAQIKEPVIDAIQSNQSAFKLRMEEGPLF